jgi:hypothetical protein
MEEQGAAIQHTYLLQYQQFHIVISCRITKRLTCLAGQQPLKLILDITQEPFNYIFKQLH